MTHQHELKSPTTANLRLVSSNPNPKPPFNVFGSGGGGFLDFKGITTVLVGGVILFFTIKFLRSLT